MSRSKTYGLVLALLASAALSTACTRTDATGPSDQHAAQPSFEGQGPTTVISYAASRGRVRVPREGDVSR